MRLSKMAAHSNTFSQLVVFGCALHHGCFSEVREKALTPRLGFSMEEQKRWRSSSPFYVIYSFIGKPTHINGESPVRCS